MSEFAFCELFSSFFRILQVADNHRISRIGLQVMLQEMGSRQQFEVEEAETTEEALTKVLAGNFHVVVMDYDLPGRGGPKATELMVARRPEICVLDWSYHAERAYAEQMMQAGKRFYSNEIARRLLEPVLVPTVEDKMNKLSRREKEVFRLILDGLQSREIAEKLRVCRRTVRGMSIVQEGAAAETTWRLISAPFRGS
jgi:two-component system invasion response regulator UvrY